MPSLDVLMTDTRVLRSTHAIEAGDRERYEENHNRIMHVLDQMGNLALQSVDTRLASNSCCEEDYSQLEVWNLLMVTSSY